MSHEILKALIEIRNWCQVEGCTEQVAIADKAMIAAGLKDIPCFQCQGFGEWDEGPLPADGYNSAVEKARPECASQYSPVPDPYRDTVKKLAAVREKRLAELAEENTQLRADLAKKRPEIFFGTFAEVYGDLDAEDCAMLDREWARWRGYILPSNGTSTLSRPAGEKPSLPLKNDHAAEPQASADTDELGLYDLGESFLAEYERATKDGCLKNFVCAESPVEVLWHLINEVGELRLEIDQLRAIRQQAVKPAAWMSREHIEAYMTGNQRGIAWASPQQTEFFDVALYAAGAIERAAVADQIIGQIEERFPNWRSYRDLIDCIDCTLRDAKGCG